MKKVLFIMVICYLPISANAQAGGDTQFLRGEGGFGDTLTAEYFWSHEKLSGYGFYDHFEKGDLRYTTEHALYYSMSESFYLAGEVTQSTFGNYEKFGAGVKLDSFLSDTIPLETLNVTYYGKAWGAPEEQVELVWSTKQFSLIDGVGFYISGFANLPNDGPKLVQPQLWFTFDKSNVEAGLEFEQFGHTQNTSLAFRYNF